MADSTTPSRLAVIDCGTNTFNLLVVDWQDDHRQVLHRDRMEVKLNRDLLPNGNLSAAAIQRAKLVLQKYMQVIRQKQVDAVRAVATSAVRSAPNGVLFAQQIKQELNLDLQIISGDEEAELIFLGVQQTIPHQTGHSLIMDIGGGSTEFILTDGRLVTWKQSFDLGAARIINSFQPSDPLSAANIQAIEEGLERELHPLFALAQKHPPATLIGSSGSFDSLADVLLQAKTGRPLGPKQTHFVFPLDQTIKLCETLMQANYHERMQIEGIPQLRADMIGIASLFIRFIIKKLKISRLTLSTFSLKEGMLWKMAHDPL